MNAQNIGGYFYDADTKTLPVFINYDKAEDAIAYEDRFLSETNLIALSKHPRKITSGDVVHIYKRGEEEKAIESSCLYGKIKTIMKQKNSIS